VAGRQTLCYYNPKNPVETTFSTPLKANEICALLLSCLGFEYEEHPILLLPILIGLFGYPTFVLVKGREASSQDLEPHHTIRDKP